MTDEKKDQKINTEGGAYIGGNVRVKNGDFVGRDKITNQTDISMEKIEAIVKAFAPIELAVTKLPQGEPETEAAQNAIIKIREEVEKGEKADGPTLEKWFRFLAKNAPDVWDVAVTTLANPVLGLVTVIRKVVEKAKEEGQ